MDTLTTSKALELDHFNWIEFVFNVFGSVDVTYIVSVFSFAFIGAVFARYFHFKMRGERNPATPSYFSLFFMIQDNITKLLAGLLAVFICYRFSNEFFGETATIYLALGYGLTSDLCVEFIGKLVSGRSPIEAFTEVFKKPKETPKTEE